MFRYDRRSPEGKKAGTWLAGGFRGVLFATIGDLDFNAKWLKLPRWSTESSPCALCRCVKHGALSWLDNRYPDAPWIQSLWTRQEWLQWSGHSKIALYSLPWMSACNTFYDWMHCKHLGADQYIFGSVLWLICFTILPGSPAQNVQILWKEIKAFYKKNPSCRSRYRGLWKLSMFVRKSGFPKLRGKAAEIKHFSQVAVHLWKKYMKKSGDDDTVKLHRLTKLLLAKVHELNTILDNYPTSSGFYALPDDVGNLFIKTCFTMVQLHKQLCDFCKQREIKAFNITAKSHCMLHSALHCKTLHPGLVWCYQGESFMRVIQRVLQSCIRGNHPFNAMSKTTRHYQLGMQLKYEQEMKSMF